MKDCIISNNIRNSGYDKNIRKIYEKYYKVCILNNYCVCHECDNSACINPIHLFLGTYSDNEKDKLLKGRHCGKNGKRLTVQDVIDIRNFVKERGKYRGIWVELSKKYGVYPTTIQQAAERKNWKWI